MNARVVIVGGGFGGLEAAFSVRSLAGDEASVTLIDRQEYHSFLPSIHEVISGKITCRSIQIPLATILAPAGIRFVRDTVTGIDPAGRRITTGTGAVAYDSVVVATGAENHFFGVPGALEHSFRFRTPDDALRIHAQLTSLLARGEAGVRLVLAGGGTEGVEVAGELLDLIKDSGREDDLAGGEISITVVEAQQQLLPGFPQAAREFAENYLRERGVAIMTGQRIMSVADRSLTLASGTEIPRSMLIWSGGIRPSPLIDGLPLPKDPAGWIVVNDHLRSPADDRIYAVGDVATVQGLDGPLALQRLAYHAQDQASVAGINISSDLRGGDPVRYEPRYRPQLISIGRHMGIYAQGDVFRTGNWVVGMKKAVERRHLMSCLSRPLISGVSRRIPGSTFLKRLGLKLSF